MDTFRRELIRDVKVAYFDWLRAQRFVEIAESTRELVAENLRVNRAQYENGRLTRDEVLRLEAELATVEQEQLDVERQALLAQSFFNFLLNRSLDASVEVDSALIDRLEEQDGHEPLLPEIDAMDLALEQREELAELEAAEDAAQAGIALARAGLRPALDLVADYGIEGVEYRVQSDADFWQASLLLEWTFWDSGQTRARRRQAELEADRVRTQRAEVELQLRLEVRDAWRRLEVAQRSVSVARERLRSATEAYRIVERRYEGGVVPQVSLIDARSELTRARVGLTTSYFAMLARDAELERVVAEVELPSEVPSRSDSSDSRR
jgi:outer membrane protein TolC